MKCKNCGKLVEDCGLHATAVTCDTCVQKGLLSSEDDTVDTKSLKGGNDKMVDKTTKANVEQAKKLPAEDKPKKEGNKFGPAKYVKCSKCSKECFTRAEVYDARVKKFGSEAAMLKGYVCRDCKKKA